MNNELSLSMLWGVFKNTWKKILLITLAVMLVAGLFTHFCIKKIYSSSATFIVINTSPSTDNNMSPLINQVEQLSNTYVELIESEKVMIPLSEYIKEEYGLEYTPSQLRSMISTRVNREAATFSVRVSNPNKEHAYVIAKYLAEEAPEKVKQVVKRKVPSAPISPSNNQLEDCFTVINEPKLAKRHDSPNLVQNTFLAGFVAAIVSYVIFCALAFNDKIVKSEEDLKKYTDKYPLIGTIPAWYNR